MTAPLAGYFLGAHGEQRELFERLLAEHVSSHFDWRRAFHPADAKQAPPPPEWEAYAARTRAEVARLSSALQRSIPVSSPRYIGHMTSDLMLPAVLAQMVTTLYNPNNVSSEVAPVTIGMEGAAAMQLAAMIGYRTEPGAPDHAWGHLTSGGTVANLESLWIARAVRCWPVAAYRAGVALGMDAMTALLPADEDAAFGLSVADALALHSRVGAWLATLPDAERADIESAIEGERIEHRGAHAYPPLHVLVPMTAHYSWRKAMRALGFGDAQLHKVPVTDRLRLDAHALEFAVDELYDAGERVLAVVPVLGTTEYGTLDPVHEVVALRDRCAGRGRSFWVHVDAAWGGYLATLFRGADGAQLDHDAVRHGFRWFPSKPVYDAVCALPRCDSVTVDPHKLGYVPFGVGALLLRDGRCRQFVSQEAPYVFDAATRGPDEPGRYALEGSRPGAMAAAVYTAHHVLPLHAEAFGKLPAASICANEQLYSALTVLNDELDGVARIVVPYEPDTNLVCIAVNPAGSRSLRALNAFTAALQHEMSPAAGVRTREYFASRTRLKLADLTPEGRADLLARLGVEADDDHLFLIRHTLMNPVSRVTDYCAYLGRLIRSERQRQLVLGNRDDPAEYR